MHYLIIFFIDWEGIYPCPWGILSIFIRVLRVYSIITYSSMLLACDKYGGRGRNKEEKKITHNTENDTICRKWHNVKSDNLPRKEIIWLLLFIPLLNYLNKSLLEQVLTTLSGPISILVKAAHQPLFPCSKI